ncbi:hypothetical protein BC629DRAFT_1556332 [Irpex lacteus]|nr:hypothetical protein BC629DRAFT_1556332 [Irpex lacteus]
MLSVSRSIGTIRNAFAPVNILPAEVCEEPYAWIAVTHVCRYWRETALSFPALWSNIDSYSTLAALTFLNRSAATDARAYLRDAVGTSGISPSLDRGRFLQSIAYHSERYKELHIQPAFRYGSLPLLFDGHLPNLEKLTLANFSQWSLHQFGTKLTHLCLMDQPLRGRMSMDRFMDFLFSCEVLEELVLADAGPNIFEMPPGLGSSEGKLVYLRHLRALHLGEWPTPHSVAQFLEHIILPPTTKIFIWADCLFRREESFAMLLPRSLKHLHPLHHLTAVHVTYRPATREYPQLLSVQDGVLVFYLTSPCPPLNSPSGSTPSQNYQKSPGGPSSTECPASVP